MENSREKNIKNVKTLFKNLFGGLKGYVNILQLHIRTAQELF